MLVDTIRRAKMFRGSSYISNHLCTMGSKPHLEIPRITTIVASCVTKEVGSF